MKPRSTVQGEAWQNDFSLYDLKRKLWPIFPKAILKKTEQCDMSNTKRPTFGLKSRYFKPPSYVSCLQLPPRDCQKPWRRCMVWHDKSSSVHRVQEQCRSCEVYKKKKKRSKTSYEIKLGQNHPKTWKKIPCQWALLCVTQKEILPTGVCELQPIPSSGICIFGQA